MNRRTFVGVLMASLLAAGCATLEPATPRVVHSLVPGGSAPLREVGRAVDGGIIRTSKAMRVLASTPNSRTFDFNHERRGLHFTGTVTFSERDYTISLKQMITPGHDENDAFAYYNKVAVKLDREIQLNLATHR